MPEIENLDLAVPLVNLTNENTLQNLDDSDIEILYESLASLHPHNGVSLNLEPLNPDAEYQLNLNRIFINLEEYARSAFSVNLHY